MEDLTAPPLGFSNFGKFQSPASDRQVSLSSLSRIIYLVLRKTEDFRGYNR